MARMNYIQNMTKQFGENWIIALKPDDIQRGAKRIVKEMVKGQFNYEEVGTYFTDMKFLENLLIACRNELEINILYYNMAIFYKQYNPVYPPLLDSQINHLACLNYIYNLVISRLEAVKNTGNIGNLADISALLYSYRNHLN